MKQLVDIPIGVESLDKLLDTSQWIAIVKHVIGGRHHAFRPRVTTFFWLFPFTARKNGDSVLVFVCVNEPRQFAKKIATESDMKLTSAVPFHWRPKPRNPV